MEIGVHLPLIAFDQEPLSLDELLTYTETAKSLGFQALAANDHLLWARPWLDGPTALAAVLARSGQMTLATTVALPVVRGPVPLAKTLGALDVLSGGRMQVAVGPGSSPLDYAAVGIDFDERWKRLDEAIQVLRVLWQKGSVPFNGQFYSTEGIALEPYPAQQGGPPIWVGSWGSQAGLKRVARLGDGWLASAYNTTPALFAEGLERLHGELERRGRDPETFPNALATMFTYVTEDKAEAEHILNDVLAPAIKRPVDELRERLLIGSAADNAAKLVAYERAGVGRIYLWPVADPVRQLYVLREQVLSFVVA